MAAPLMPKATAVWLVENTALTFEQIAEFCNLHPLEIQAIADGEVGIGIQGLDPIVNGELTQEEIDRCVADPNGRLVQAKTRNPQPRAKPKGARYTPVSKRQDRPDAIAWLLKNYPELGDAQISRLIGTTKPTINSVRDKTHWNAQNIKPQNPVGLGLCSRAGFGKGGHPGSQAPGQGQRCRPGDAGRGAGPGRGSRTGNPGERRIRSFLIRSAPLKGGASHFRRTHSTGGPGSRMNPWARQRACALPIDYLSG